MFLISESEDNSNSVNNQQHFIALISSCIREGRGIRRAMSPNSDITLIHLWHILKVNKRI